MFPVKQLFFKDETNLPALPYLSLVIDTFAMTMKWLTTLCSDASQLFWCNPFNAMF